MRKYTAKECRCWSNYPNEAHKKLNGSWKCIDCYELVKQGSWKHKTRCKLKESDSGMTIEEVSNYYQKMIDSSIFQDMKEKGQIKTATLIAHPKHKKIIVECGLDIDIIFSDICPEDKIYMVNDPDMKEEIKRNREHLYKGSESE